MNKTWYEEVEEKYRNNIKDNETLIIALEILEDRKELLGESLTLIEENNRLKEEDEQLKKELNNLFFEYINYMTKADFAIKCNISRPYLDKLLNTGMSRLQIYNFCLMRKKIKEGKNE